MALVSRAAPTRVRARTELDRRASGHTPHLVVVLARIHVLGVFEMEMDSLTAESTSTKRGPYRRYIRDLDAPIPKTTLWRMRKDGEK